MTALYLIGSLRNEHIPEIAAELRSAGINVFDNWYSAGPEADDYWKAYERGRGHSYQEALNNHSAKNVYAFDTFHLNRCHAAVLALPAGRSGHLEAGWAAGLGKPVFLLLDEEGEPERLDVMSKFLYSVSRDMSELLQSIANYPWPKLPAIKEPTAQDVLWLAGLMEGDGTFCITKGGVTKEGRPRCLVPRLSLQMTDIDTIERAAAILDCAVISNNKSKRNPHWKPVFSANRGGLAAIEWMRILRPYMGKRRKQQIGDTVVKWLEARKYHRADQRFWAEQFGIV